MLETNNPQIDAVQLLEKVASELKMQQKKVMGRQNVGASEKFKFNDPYLWGQLSSFLDVAEQNVNAGAEVPSMLNYRGIVRKFARFLGKFVIFFGRVITNPQRNFNSSILNSLRITLDGIRDMNRNTILLERKMRQIEEKSALIDYLKTGLTTQERRVSVLMEELQNQAVPVVGTREDVSRKVNTPDILDPLYVAFEEKFRGSREEIRERLLEYVPLIRESGAGVEGREILDIGCGRGEWLGIMADEGLLAKGLDLNHVLVRECCEKGYTVEENDALSFLKSLPDSSIGAITSFHLIEHLGFEERVALFDESVRVLKSGGIALFETPNPRNLLIGACNFWADPTHLRPLYPETHQFLMEYRGFSNVELLFLHPHEGEQRLPEEESPELASRLNEILSCARDYTIVGYKA